MYPNQQPYQQGGYPPPQQQGGYPPPQQQGYAPQYASVGYPPPGGDPAAQYASGGYPSPGGDPASQYASGGYPAPAYASQGYPPAGYNSPAPGQQSFHPPPQNVAPPPPTGSPAPQYESVPQYPSMNFAPAPGVDYNSGGQWAPPSPQMEQQYSSGDLTSQQLYAQTADYFVQDPMLANYDAQYGHYDPNGSMQQPVQVQPQQGFYQAYDPEQRQALYQQYDSGTFDYDEAKKGDEVDLASSIDSVDDSDGYEPDANGPGILKVTVHECSKLAPAMRSEFTSDPYVKLSLEGKEQKTSVKRCDLNPRWENALFSFAAPVLPPTLEVSVWSKNVTKDDVFLGSVAISLDSLKPNEPNTQEYKLENIASGSVHLTLEYDPDTVWTKKKRKGLSGAMKKVSGIKMGKGNTLGEVVSIGAAEADRSLIRKATSWIVKGLLLMTRRMQAKGYKGGSAFGFRMRAGSVSPIWFSISIKSDVDIEGIKRRIKERPVIKEDIKAVKLQTKKALSGSLASKGPVPAVKKEEKVPDLAPSWEMRIDPSSQRKYFVDTLLKKTHWELPEEGKLPSMAPQWDMRRDANGRNYFVDGIKKTTHWELPNEGKCPEMAKGWEMRRDQSGRNFFVDTKTKKTFWELPKEGTKAGEKAKEGPKLKKGWMRRWDYDQSKEYWVNTATNQKYYELPKEAIAKEGDETNEAKKDDIGDEYEKLNPGSDGAPIRMIDKICGLLLFQIEQACLRMEEIGLHGKVVVRAGIKFPAIVAGCMVKIQVSANSENVRNPGKPATKDQLHDMMLALKL